MSVECTLAYVAPARIARSSSAYSPGPMPWPVGPITSAGSIVPETVPVAGPGTAGVPAGVVGLLHRNALIPPHVASCAQVDVGLGDVALEPAVGQAVADLAVAHLGLEVAEARGRERRGRSS